MSAGALDLEGARKRGDPLADAAVAALRRRGEVGHPWTAILRLAPVDEACARLVEQVKARPDWLDEEKLRRGCDLFARHALDVTNVFTLGSLVQTYLVPGIADVLMVTGLLRHQVQRRLAGTGKFVLDVVTPGAFEAEGHGLAAVMRVRLLHARVRAGLSRHPEFPGSVPIDEAETLLTLCVHSVCVVRGLRRLGVDVDPREAEAYQHLWRYAGYLMGLPASSLCNSLEAEGRLYDHLAAHMDAPNAASRALSSALLDAARFEPPLFLPRPVLAQFTRFFIGDDKADALGLPRGDRSQAALRQLARARARVGRSELPRPAPRHPSRAPARGRLGPRLGFRYYDWMVQRTARLSGRPLHEEG